MNNERYIFRGKRMDNREWITGYLYVTHLNEYEIGTYSFNSNIERLTQTVDPATIGQCTGVRDKDEELIFEGDVFRCSWSDTGVVTWGNNRAISGERGYLNDRWVIVWNGEANNRYRNDLGFWAYFGSVIGNIHDNPELIERS